MRERRVMERDVCSTNGDSGPKIEKVLVSAYTIPNGWPGERWHFRVGSDDAGARRCDRRASTASVIPYADVSTAWFVKQNLAPVVEGGMRCTSRTPGGP